MQSMNLTSFEPLYLINIFIYKEIDTISYF